MLKIKQSTLQSYERGGRYRGISQKNWAGDLGESLDGLFASFKGMLKKAASGVLALFPCSRTMSTLRA
jgi:hypothetical protein